MKKAKLVIIFTVSLGLVLIVAQNRTPIQGHFLCFTGEMPLILLLFLTGAGGFVLGLFATLFIKNSTKS